MMVVLHHHLQLPLHGSGNVPMALPDLRSVANDDLQFCSANLDAEIIRLHEGYRK